MPHGLILESGYISGCILFGDFLHSLFYQLPIFRLYFIYLTLTME